MEFTEQDVKNIAALADSGLWIRAVVRPSKAAVDLYIELRKLGKMPSRLISSHLNGPAGCFSVTGMTESGKTFCAVFENEWREVGSLSGDDGEMILRTGQYVLRHVLINGG